MLEFIQALLGIIQLRITLVTDFATAAGARFQVFGGEAFDISWTGHAGIYLLGFIAFGKEVAWAWDAVGSRLGGSF